MMRVLPAVGLITLSVVALIVCISGNITFQLDFNGDLYLAGQRILHGIDPYQPRFLAAQAAIVKSGGTIGTVPSPRYPATILVAAAPLSLLPMWLADGLFMLLSAAAVVCALRLLGIRDWRCIAVACLSWPVVSGVWTGNASPLLLLGAAVAWRWRARLWTPAAAIGATVIAKLFLWPLGVWLIVTKRFRTFALSLVLTLVATLLAWAVIGFAGFTEYPQMLRNVASIGDGRGCSLVSALISLGVSSGVARTVAVICGGALLVAAWRVTRLPDGDGRAFGLCVMAGLIATPVAWAHYLVLLFIPIALLTPTLSAIWFLPMFAVLAPSPVVHPELWVSIPALTIELIIIGRLCSPLMRKAANSTSSPQRYAMGESPVRSL